MSAPLFLPLFPATCLSIWSASLILWVGCTQCVLCGVPRVRACVGCQRVTRFGARARARPRKAKGIGMTHTHRSRKLASERGSARQLLLVGAVSHCVAL